MRTSLIISVYFRAGVESISNKLKTNLESGLLGGDFPARKEFFGDNFRPPLKAKTFCKIFFEALDDFMLKVLLVAATGSLIFEYIGADPDHYSTGKSHC
jgi:Ca2+ transporting ATPase